MASDLETEIAKIISGAPFPSARSRTKARSVLSLVLEEAVAKAQYRHDMVSNTEASRACCRNVIRDLRSLIPAEERE